jgi:hypothetical protein
MGDRFARHAAEMSGAAPRDALYFKRQLAFLAGNVKLRFGSSGQ